MSAGNTPKDEYHNELRRSIHRLSQNKTPQSHVSVATTEYKQEGGGNESIQHTNIIRGLLTPGRQRHS